MGFHDLKFLRGQFSRFEQDAVGNADLSHVVKEGACD